MNSVRGWLAALIMALTVVPAAHAATKIVFLYTAVPSYIGSFVAKNEGLFEKYSLDVELTMAATGSHHSRGHGGGIGPGRRADSHGAAAGQ